MQQFRWKAHTRGKQGYTIEAVHALHSNRPAPTGITSRLLTLIHVHAQRLAAPGQVGVKVRVTEPILVVKYRGTDAWCPIFRHAYVEVRMACQQAATRVAFDTFIGNIADAAYWSGSRLSPPCS
jgi:hypothetical protein